jgi:nucleotide-binding universal stress UspA family protein
MYKKILVPLDGSEVAECTLEHVTAIATQCSVPEVVLLGVAEPIRTSGEIYSELGVDWVQKAQEGIYAATEAYLKKAAGKLNSEGVNARTIVLKGNAAEQILEYADKNKVDLIIMATHGSSGIVRWLLGSVTDRVLRHSSVPVLAVAPQGARKGK